MFEKIKRYILPLCLITVAIYISCFLVPLDNQASAATGTVNGSVVNVRSGPGTQYQVAGTLYQNTKVDIVEKSGEWYKVKYGTLVGWLHSSLLSVEQSDIIVKVIEEVVNLRSGPGTSYNIVGQAHIGDNLTLLGTEGEWYKVKTASGQEVYIRSDMAAPEDQTAVTVMAAAPPVTTTQPAAGSAAIAYNTQTLKIMLDGQPMSFEVAPQIDNNRVLVPLRAIFEAMGAVVEWNQATQTATATRGDIKVVLPLNSTTPTVNGTVWKLDVPAKVVQQRTLAPLRFVGEALGGTATWDAANFTVILNSPSAIPVQLEGVKISSVRDAGGLKIIMESAVQMETHINGTTGKVIYEFTDRQIDGTSTLKEYLGAQLVTVQGINQGDNAVVEIQIPTGVQYQSSSENYGKREVLTIPNFISGVERKTFSSNGENIIINAIAPITYTTSQSGTKLEVVFNNMLPGKVQTSYNFDSNLIDSVAFQKRTVGSTVQTVLTLTTTKTAKFAIGLSNYSCALNILFVDQSEIEPRIPMVVLDAGHGGRDPGASGANISEKDANLAVVLKAGELLTQRGIKVVYTRQDDTYVDLDLRSSMANLYNAALFVSVHCNASTSQSANGTETYYYAPLANPALYIQKDDRFELASLLQQSMVAKLGLYNRGVKSDNLSVLRQTTMPSALVEMAFISNPTEGELLKQQQFRDLAAQAIADGIESYMKANINTQ